MPASTNKILANLLMSAIATQSSWSRTWMRSPAVNCTSKKPFRGVNRLVLTVTAAKNGWSGSRWGTEAQWTKKGFYVPQHTPATRILSMVEAGPMDTTCMRYGVKRITLVRPHEEYCGVQVGDDDTWTPIQPNLSGVLSLVGGAFGGHVALSVPDMSLIKSSDIATADERYASHLARAALRLTIESQMLHLLPDEMASPDVVGLACEIGTAFVCNDFGLVPERLRDQPTIRRWCSLLIGQPEVAMFAAGLAQHSLDAMTAAAAPATNAEAKAA